MNAVVREAHTGIDQLCVYCDVPMKPDLEAYLAVTIALLPASNRPVETLPTMPVETLPTLPVEDAQGDTKSE